ncbi:serine/threonine-protein kinase [Nannocystis pusilla]|uniref:serine/threonine-protein kinase n=1 Tax=Nannocystis pusilla TaxID=889268 RepID=UPI003B7F39ED
MPSPSESSLSRPLNQTAHDSATDDALVGRGTLVGRYLVLGYLGSGGMGVVYAAYDPDLDRKIALKLVKTGASDSRRRARLLREAQAMARLTHPNVVTVHDVGALGDQVFVAMELVDGVTLTRWMQEHHGDWRTIVAIFIMVGRGLAAAHAVGLIHRDLKPDNIMIGVDGQVRVMDFGLARSSRSNEETTDPAAVNAALAVRVTHTGALLGTPAYMAPEQWKRGSDVGEPADQFAYCVALWEALYGERPFPGRTFAALMLAVTEGKRAEPRAPGRIPARLRRALERGLSTEPRDRWPSMVALVDELEAISASETRLSLHIGRRGRSLSLLLYFLLTAAVAVIIFAFGDASRPTLPDVLVFTYILLLLISAAVALARRSLWSSLVNRTVAVSYVLCLVTTVVHRHFGIAFGQPLAQVFAVDLLLLAALPAAALFPVVPRLAAPSLVPLLAAVVAAVRPEWTFYAG